MFARFGHHGVGRDVGTETHSDKTEGRKREVGVEVEGGGKQGGKGEGTENVREKETDRQGEKKEEGEGTKGRRGSNIETEKQKDGERYQRGEGRGTGAKLGVRVRTHTHILVCLWGNKKVKPRFEFLVKTSKVLCRNIGNGPAHIVR